MSTCTIPFVSPQGAVLAVLVLDATHVGTGTRTVVATRLGGHSGDSVRYILRK